MFAAKIMRGGGGSRVEGGSRGEGVLGGGSRGFKEGVPGGREGEFQGGGGVPGGRGSSRGEGGPGISENVHDRLPYKFSTIEIINKWT